MPRSDCIEFTDHLADNGGFATARHSRGFFLSQKLLIILGISAVLLAVVVGLIAHFVTASGCQGDCSGEQGEGQLWSQCARLAQLKGSCICANTTLPTAVAPTARPQKLDVRIPGDLKAIHYNIKLRPDIYSADPSKFRFYGYSRVYMECQKATKTIMLHILKLTIDGASIVFAANDSAVVAPKFVRWEHDKKREFFVGHLDGAMEAGKVYYLEMKYTGPLTTDLSGLYLSKYTHSGNQTTYIATSQLQPTSARKVFPSFDEPGLKATFDITLTRKDPMKSLSNMELVKTVINEELPDWKDDIYDRTPVMSTYLLAMIVCDFEHVERKTSKDTVVRIWARPEAKTQTAYADSIGADILEYFEAYFDIDFPLKKIDMIAIPDFSAGAMENWGLITYRETALLYDSKISSQSNKQRVAIVVAHELAHQWFGNLVTPAWWDDIWLNEGFASYVEYLGVDKVAKEFKMFDQFLLSDTQGALTLDGLSHSHPIYVNVGDPSEIDEIFDAISYSKGACVIRMIDYFLGEENFKKGVTQYLKEHQYGSAAHTDLFKALTKAAAEGGITDGSTALDVTEIMFTWIKQMGYPVVTISRTGAGTARATQEHFLIDPNSKPDPKYPTPYNYKWYIPLSFTSNETSPDWSANKSSVIWMKMNDVTLRQEEGFPSDSQNWVIGNIGQYGFYRMNYDAENWEKLIGQLQYDHTVIDVKNRAQLVNDAFNLARAERLETGVPLRLSDYLKKEKDYLPWESYDSNIFYVDSMLERSALYGKFTTVMEEQVQDLYTDLGWTVKPGESFLDKYLRNIAIYRACYYGNKHCLDESTKEFASWVKNPATNPINVDLKTTVYCNAIRYGGVAEWEFAFDQYQKTNVASEKSKLMAALSCTKIPWILHRYLNFSLDENKIRKQDAVGVITGIANNAIGRCFAWDFFRANWDTIFQRYGVTSFSFPGLVTGITRNFNTKYELEQLEEIIAKHPNLGSGQRSFELAVERTKNNIRWVQRNEKEINVWLASR